MARVIKFHVPRSFEKPSRTSAKTQLGKIIEFPRNEEISLAAIQVLEFGGDIAVVPTEAAFVLLEDPEGYCEPSSGILGTLSRAVPRGIWSRPPVQ